MRQTPLPRSHLSDHRPDRALPDWAAQKAALDQAQDELDEMQRRLEQLRDQSLGAAVPHGDVLRKAR